VISFSIFRVFWSFMPLEILNQQNAKKFSQAIKNHKTGQSQRIISSLIITYNKFGVFSFLALHRAF